MREDDIRTAIINLSPDRFERFTRELVRRELYHGLNPTSESYDLGEDSRTEASTVFMHDGRWISLAVSKTATLHKIKTDCRTMQRNERDVDIVVFVTDEDIRTDTEEDWRDEIQTEFGWKLELRTPRWLAPVASKPEYESLVDDYLHIPPPDGDFVQTIQLEFDRCTTGALALIEDRIPGLSEPLIREETAVVEEQLASRRPVLLTGAAGSGKSGLVAALARNSLDTGQMILLLDARSVVHVRTETELRAVLGLRGSVCSALVRASRYRGCRLIIDQLDNVVGLPISDILVDLALQTYSQSDSIEVVVVSRNQERHERRLLARLLKNGFDELRSSPISVTRVENILSQLNITNYSADTAILGRNLLNLALIARIHQQQSDYDFSVLTSEVHLWEQYVEVLIDKEGAIGEQMLAEAAKWATHALNSPDGRFELPFPLARPLQRLISWAIITPFEGRVHRFRHERFQEFIYAWDATQRLSMPSDVLTEIAPYRSQSILLWMDGIYERSGSIVREQFLEEMFDVG